MFFSLSQTNESVLGLVGAISNNPHSKTTIETQRLIAKINGIQQEVWMAERSAREVLSRNAICSLLKFHFAIVLCNGPRQGNSRPPSSTRYETESRETYNRTHTSIFSYTSLSRSRYDDKIYVYIYIHNFDVGRPWIDLQSHKRRDHSYCIIPVCIMKSDRLLGLIGFLF